MSQLRYHTHCCFINCAAYGTVFGLSACLFAGEVYDEGGSLYAELYLFYCEEEPVTDAYQVVEKLGPNWYFHCMYRE